VSEQESKPVVGAEQKVTPKFELLIEGAPADIGIVEKVINIRVRQDMDLTDVVEVRLSNPDLAWTEGDTFSDGKKIAVKLGYEEKTIEHIAEGQIVRRECEFPVSGPAVLCVLAFGKKFKMRQGKKSKNFNDMKVSDIVSQLASDEGLQAEVDDTGEVVPYLLQIAKDNLTFIRELADRVGFDFVVDKTNTKLKFKKPDTSPAPAATLKWGKDLLAFRPRLSTSSQLSSVTVKGWNVAEKKMVEHTAVPADVHFGMGGTKTGSQIAEGTYGQRKVLCVDVPVQTVKQAESMAKARMNQAAAGYCQGEGTCQGNNAIYPGAIVEVQGCGNRVDGKYFVTSTLHYYEPRAGYSTHFGVKRSTEGAPVAPQQPPAPAPPPETQLPEREHFVEIKITSETGEKLTGLNYTVTLASGETRQGTLDDSHVIRIEGITDPGEAKIEFQPPEGMKVLE
jgi:uncharacterized protein